MNPNYHIIIVAGGSGKRMNSATPKQYLPVNGVPLVAVTINRMAKAIGQATFTVVIAEKDSALWKSCMAHIPFHSAINVAFGGPERYHSVKSALSFVKPGEIVAVHDAVRPLFATEVIRNGFMVAGKSGSAVPVIELRESLREIDGALSRSVNRSKFRICQTPQFFQASVLLDAYRQSYRESFTDDASVVESAGNSIRLIEGNPENIKITTPADLLYAGALLNSIT